MLPSFRVQNFRCFKDLELRDLGRVNLIVGPNGAGKSTLLEALQIYCHGGATNEVWSLLKGRDELSTAAMPLHTQASALFHGGIVIGGARLGPCDEPDQELRLSIQRAIQPEGRGRLKLEAENADVSGDIVWAYVVEYDGRKRIIQLSQAQMERERPAWEPDISFVNTWPGEVNVEELRTGWNEIAGFPEEDQAISAMRCLIPDLERIYVLQDVEQRSLVRIRRKAEVEPLPLRRFGDGALHLFELVTSLLTADAGALALLDEVDSRLHHSIHDDLWRVIFNVARARDLQVFATTHSMDCIRAFQRVSAADAETGAVIRLDNRWGDVRGQVLSEAELADVAQFGTEIR